MKDGEETGQTLHIIADNRWYTHHSHREKEREGKDKQSLQHA